MSGVLGVRHWSHVIINPVDIDTSLEFYTTLFGFEVLSDEEISGPGLDEIVGQEGARARIALGLVGGQKVEFVQFAGAELRDIEEGQRGLQGFTVRVNDLDEAMAACAAHGVPIASGPSDIHGFRQFMILDPDGVMLEISQPPPGVEVSGPLQ